VQVPHNNRNNPDNSTEGNTADTNSERTGNSDHSSDCSNHPCNLDFGVSNDSKFVYDPGGNTFDTEDGSARDDGDSTSSSSDDVPCNADAYRSLDHDRDKSILTASDVDPFLPLDFVQVTRPVDAPHSATNLPTILLANSKRVDTAQRAFPHHLVLPLDLGHTAPVFTRTPLDPLRDNSSSNSSDCNTNDADSSSSSNCNTNDADSSSSSSSNDAVSIAITACAPSNSDPDFVSTDTPRASHLRPLIGDASRSLPQPAPRRDNNSNSNSNKAADFVNTACTLDTLDADSNSISKHTAPSTAAASTPHHSFAPFAPAPPRATTNQITSAPASHLSTLTSKSLCSPHLSQISQKNHLQPLRRRQPQPCPISKSHKATAGPFVLSLARTPSDLSDNKLTRFSGRTHCFVLPADDFGDT
jgi:hypothetical protein